MFVTSVLDEFWRKFPASKRHGQECDEWKQYLQAQKDRWGPTELFERCCPRWLGSGRLIYVSHHGGLGFEPVNKQEWKSCPGGCKKCHPSITLFFDATLKKTVATISMRLDPFVKCLDEMVRDGRAVRKSPLYYVLNGYIRENETLLREHDGFSSHLVEVAMGALATSDEYQRKELEYKRNKTRQPREGVYSQLEEVLEICRLHRLAEDLDSHEVYCMRRSSKMLGRIASRIAKQRIRDAKLQVVPLVDGISLTTGVSMFRRHCDGDDAANGEPGKLIQTEDGRIVEYVRYKEIKLRPTDQLGQFQAVDFLERPARWDCEELSFAQLEREWGDIGCHEYVGQKLLVEWKPTAVDTCRNSTREEGRGIQLASINLNATPSRTLKCLKAQLLTAEIHISESLARQVDEVTVRYHGQLYVKMVRVNFLSLVVAYARSLEHSLKTRCSIIERSRPLLDHELAYLAELRKTARVNDMTR